MLNRLPRSSAFTFSGVPCSSSTSPMRRRAELIDLRHPAGAMDGQHLQAVALLEFQAAQALADQRRARQQHAFDDGRLLLVLVRVRQVHIGLEVQALDVLDLEQIGAQPFDEQLVAGLQLESASFFSPRIVSSPRISLTDREPGIGRDLGVLERLADQRPVVDHQDVGLILALADLLLRLLVVALRDQAHADQSTCRGGRRWRSGCRPGASSNMPIGGCW